MAAVEKNDAQKVIESKENEIFNAMKSVFNNYKRKIFVPNVIRELKNQNLFVSKKEVFSIIDKLVTENLLVEVKKGKMYKLKNMNK